MPRNRRERQQRAHREERPLCRPTGPRGRVGDRFDTRVVDLATPQVRRPHHRRAERGDGSVARRAEGLTVGLATMESVNDAAVTYLNRLSDWFFVAARIANDEGRGDVLWVPGANRD